MSKQVTDESTAMLAADDWLTSRSPWHGFFEGVDIGTNITVLYFTCLLYTSPSPRDA